MGGVGAVCLLAGLVMLAFLEHLPAGGKGLAGGLIGGGGGFLVAALGYFLLPRWWRDYCNEESNSPVYRRYMKRVWPACAVYLLTVIATMGTVQLVSSQALRALLSVLPVIPIAWMMYAMVMYLREVDEMQRRIEAEAICVAALVTSMAYLTGGFLAAAKVFQPSAASVMIWVFPVMMLVYGTAKMVITRRYR